MPSRRCARPRTRSGTARTAPPSTRRAGPSKGLQRGMQGMAQQMQQMMQGDGTEQANGEPQGQPGNAQGDQPGQRDNDPLGRPTRSRDFSDGRVKVPGAGESASQRAQRILEELRRKLGDPPARGRSSTISSACCAGTEGAPFPVTGPPEGSVLKRQGMDRLVDLLVPIACGAVAVVLAARPLQHAPRRQRQPLAAIDAPARPPAVRGDHRHHGGAVVAGGVTALETTPFSATISDKGPLSIAADGAAAPRSHVRFVACVFARSSA